jgi:CheY-like chemotaxis protein
MTTARRLLLVDDDKDNLEILTIILSAKYDVLSYPCAEEALAALEVAKPDLVLLDISMIPVDGLQCLKAIRAMPGHGSIPAMALTAHARDVERKAFLTAGFQAVVTKPILDHQVLFRSIDALLASEPAPTCRPSADGPGTDQPDLSRGAYLDTARWMPA